MMSRNSKLIYTFIFTVALIGDVGLMQQLDATPQRMRPPSPLTCSRDHLTSFQGRILAYKRGKNNIVLRVRTDEATTETFTLKWAAAEKPEKWFLLRGEEFKAADWKLIESAPGKLIAGTRIIVWVCDDGSKPVFDWRPKEK
ncbi:MAG TPA: hypothetical protein VFZ34_11255 [Blastocatellia bacterium]|nr:hypothetical protein [Blastocatellia bacterium]